MKLRVTLTLDPAVAHQAKRVARNRGMSVSGLVESLLSRETSPGSVPKLGPAFSERWAGRFTLTKKNDPRATRLKAKYRL